MYLAPIRIYLFGANRFRLADGLSGNDSHPRLYQNNMFRQSLRPTFSCAGSNCSGIGSYTANQGLYPRRMPSGTALSLGALRSPRLCEIRLSISGISLRHMYADPPYSCVVGIVLLVYNDLNQYRGSGIKHIAVRNRNRRRTKRRSIS